eukprot:Rhum_TRINITY_DN2443_c0_g1::Rhum_TRINITY_DN2443_c0_g1_i1::g.7331::m.7331
MGNQTMVVRAHAPSGVVPVLLLLSSLRRVVLNAEQPQLLDHVLHLVNRCLPRLAHSHVAVRRNRVQLDHEQQKPLGEVAPRLHNLLLVLRRARHERLLLPACLQLVRLSAHPLHRLQRRLRESRRLGGGGGVRRRLLVDALVLLHRRRLLSLLFVVLLFVLHALRRVKLLLLLLRRLRRRRRRLRLRLLRQRGQPVHHRAVQAHQLSPTGLLHALACLGHRLVEPLQLPPVRGRHPRSVGVHALRALRRSRALAEAAAAEEGGERVGRRRARGGGGGGPLLAAALVLVLLAQPLLLAGVRDLLLPLQLLLLPATGLELLLVRGLLAVARLLHAEAAEESVVEHVGVLENIRDGVSLCVCFVC